MTARRDRDATGGDRLAAALDDLVIGQGSVSAVVDHRQKEAP